MAPLAPIPPRCRPIRGLRPKVPGRARSPIRLSLIPGLVIAGLATPAMADGVGALGRVAGTDGHSGAVAAGPVDRGRPAILLGLELRPAPLGGFDLAIPGTDRVRIGAEAALGLDSQALGGLIRLRIAF